MSPPPETGSDIVDCFWANWYICTVVLIRTVVTNVLYTSLIFRELELEDVVMDGHWYCKVADFGSSKLGVFDGHKIKAYGGTQCCMAPEVIITLF
jgi:hypothetical protein